MSMLSRREIVRDLTLAPLSSGEFIGFLNRYVLVPDIELPLKIARSIRPRARVSLFFEFVQQAVGVEFERIKKPLQKLGVETLKALSSRKVKEGSMATFPQTPGLPVRTRRRASRLTSTSSRLSAKSRPSGLPSRSD